MERKKVLVVGSNGKMGECVCEILKNEYLLEKCEKQDQIDNFDADLVIDFASAGSSVVSAEYCLKNKVPLVVGATGQSKEQLEKISKVAEVAPLLVCSNFSVGVCVLKQLLLKVLKLDISEICVFEKHHSSKKDAPSGTALNLEKLICQNSRVKPQMLCERGGSEIGTHILDFYFDDEKLSLSHQAFSRKAFALGVKIATKYIFKTMKNQNYDFEKIVQNYLNQNV